MKFEITSIRDICKTNQYSYSSKDEWQYVNYLDTGNITQNKIDEIQFIDLSVEKLPSRAKRKVILYFLLFVPISFIME